ncbi:MAG: HAMP domain-containing protein [Gammaproteobacteria bacterium]|nr:MAG: HAMP domain-containing protein [Gammaproteobacteria bacterium]
MTHIPALSLKARATLILCAVVILLQASSLLLFEQNRERNILLTEATDLADRIIGIVNLANGFPRRDREQILAAAETQFLATFPDIVSMDEVACQENDFSQHMAQRIHRSFNKIPGLDAQICVRSLDLPQFSGKKLNTRGFDVLIFVNFPDSEQSIFHAILPEGSSLLADRVLAYFLLVALLTLLLAWFLIGKATAPLERLAKAADTIGVNLDSPPMDEKGPPEVARAAQAFNRMQARLARLVHGQTEMLAAISHDLRSAATRLQLRAEMLANEQERNGLMRVVSDMKQMIESVLAYVRGYESNEPVRMVNITALAESLCDDLRDEGFPVTYESHCGVVNLLCRASVLRRGLQNIIDNAIKYGGSAHLTFRCDTDYLVISITDTGPGIPEEQLQTVLQPFYRLEQSRNATTGGIGLGLAISQNIVQTMGGTLTLSNRESGGLQVDIGLPLQKR